MKRFALLSALLLCVGCNEVVLYADMPEKEANEMMALLLDAGISAAKEKGTEGRWTLNVAQGEFAKAVGELRKHGYPRDRYEDIGNLFKKSGLVSSPTEERIRLMIAGDIDHLGAALGALEQSPHHVVMRGRPVEFLLEAPAIDDVADEIHFLAVDMIEKVDQHLGVAALRPQMDIADPDGSVLTTAMRRPFRNSGLRIREVRQVGDSTVL